MSVEDRRKLKLEVAATEAKTVVELLGREIAEAEREEREEEVRGREREMGS